MHTELLEVVHRFRIERTKKDFSIENMEEGFVRRAVAIAGKHKLPTWSNHYSYERFRFEEVYQGVKGAFTTHPWNAKVGLEGYEKDLFCLNIFLQGFDTAAIIYNSTGVIQGKYVNEKIKSISDDDTAVIDGFEFTGTSSRTVHSIEWVNLMLEYGFAAITVLPKPEDEEGKVLTPVHGS